MVELLNSKEHIVKLYRISGVIQCLNLAPQFSGIISNLATEFETGFTGCSSFQGTLPLELLELSSALALNHVVESIKLSINPHVLDYSRRSLNVGLAHYPSKI